jgi:hypothetical protein
MRETTPISSRGRATELSAPVCDLRWTCYSDEPATHPCWRWSYKIRGLGPPAILLLPLCPAAAQLAPRRSRASASALAPPAAGASPNRYVLLRASPAGARPACSLFSLSLSFSLPLPFPRFYKRRGIPGSRVGLDRVLRECRLQIGCAEPGLRAPGVGRLDFLRRLDAVVLGCSRVSLAVQIRGASGILRDFLCRIWWLVFALVILRV